MHRNQEDEHGWTSSVYADKTKAEASKIRIKTYSVANVNDTDHFRSSIEPAEQHNVSSVFATAFPTLSNKLTHKDLLRK